MTKKYKFNPTEILTIVREINRHNPSYKITTWRIGFELKERNEGIRFNSGDLRNYMKEMERHGLVKSSLENACNLVWEIKKAP